MNSRYRKGLSLALFFSVATLSSAANRPAANTAPPEVKARALANYGKLPLSFEENRGQADSQVQFLSRGNGYTISLTRGGVRLNVQGPGKPGQPAKESAVRMSFAGAKSPAAITGVERQSAVSSYFVGNDAAKWLSGIPNYSRVHYRGIYPGVDLVLYGNQGRLEYDFEVAPGADPRAIRLAFEGVNDMRINRAGDLVVNTAAGEMRQHKPIVYQEGAGGRQVVEGRYVIQSHNRVAFEIAKYDAGKALIIDPVLTFATYLGSPGDELDFAISSAASQATFPAVALDPQGNVYVAGFNGGSTFAGHPVSALPPSPGNGYQVFVVKMNATGTALLYSVFFGGAPTNVGGGIAVDSSGNAYVTGFTNSTSFPITANAPQNKINGTFNAFVTKVNSTGTALLYSTYLGGSGSDWGRSIAVDSSGNAYVTGTAQESPGTDFPLVHAISSTPAAGFLTEVNSTGTAFVYSTFLSAGIGYGVAVDSGGNAYVTGSSGTSQSPAPAQGYVVKVNAEGAGIAYGPVSIGSTANSVNMLQTAGFGIALDAQTEVYVTGMTNDPNFPQITTPAAQSTYGGGLYDGFALKLNSTGALVWGTYIGGLGSSFIPERGSGIGVDLEGNAYVSGTTECIGFPTVNSISGARNGETAVLLEGTISGSTSSWSPSSSSMPVLAGPFDQVNALAFDPTGDTLYAGTSALNATGGGVYKLAGGTWTSASTGITSTTIDSVAVDPNFATNSTVYAAGSGHLYQTTNAGNSWTELAPALGTSAAIAIAKTSSSTSTVYVGSSTGLIYSTNAGSSWSSPSTPPGTGAVNALVVNPSSPSTAYAGTPTGVYQTTNGGANWSAVITGLPTGSGGVVTSLAINSTGTIYAATPDGVFYTTNAGANWTQAVLGDVLSTPSLVAVDAGNNVYVAFLGAGEATGTNGGTAPSDWSALTYSGLTQNQIMALVAPPTGSGTAYAGIVAATTAFLTEISYNGQSFLSSTCIGGADNNLGQSIAVTPYDAVYLSGATVATDFPVTPEALQPTLAGFYDDFLMGIGIPPDQINSPLPGIELSETSATLQWSSVTGATEYQLSVGTTPGGTNIFSGTTAGTSQSVDFIPCTGGTIYVQLTAEVSGSFVPASAYSYSCKSAIGDFNGSGFQDLLWQNNSTGQVNVNYYGGAGPQPQGSAVLNNGATLAGWKVVGAGDFDQNGAQDLVLQNTSTGQVVVNYYSVDGTTVTGSAVLNSGAGTAGWSVVAVADQNGDGVPDLIWQNSSTGQVNVNYYGGAGGATLTGYAVMNSGAGTAGWKVVADADFDQNGTPDLVWQNQSTGQVNVNYYGGSGGATLIGYAVLNSGAGTAGWSVVGAADWNADGIPDLVWQDNSTLQVNVNYYGGGGGAVLKGFNCLNCGSNSVGWTVVAVAPFSNSGEQSLVWQNNSTNAVNVSYYGLGGYQFQGWSQLNSGAGTTGWKVVAAADFDGNGVPDLVWQNSSTGQVNVNYYGGAGGSTLTGYAVLNSGAGTAGWSVVAAADMNGDGVPDLIWQNSSTGQVNVNYYGGSGGASLIGYAVLNSGAGTTGWKVVAAADFDGNGVPDLVWQNTSTSQVNVNYYGGEAGTTLIGYAVLNSGAGAAGWTVVGANDFDGNGVPDLVWRNNSSGEVNVNYYGGPKGAVYEGWNVLNGTPNPGWRVIVPQDQ